MVSGLDLLDLRQELDAVHPRHPEVGEHDIGIGLLEEEQSRARVVGPRHFVAILAQQRLECRRGVHLVVDHDEASFVLMLGLLLAASSRQRAG